jgi:hypothetical protein
MESRVVLRPAMGRKEYILRELALKILLETARS